MPFNNIAVVTATFAFSSKYIVVTIIFTVTSTDVTVISAFPADFFAA